MGVSGGMEPEEDKSKKLNDDVVVYLSKTETPRYSARLRAFVDLQRKRSRAAAARRRSDHRGTIAKKKNPEKHNENSGEKDENIDKGNEANKRRAGEGEEKSFLDRFRSRSTKSQEPSDRCRRRRRRCSCRRRRRRRSCRRRRRRRSCRRRRRRRSCRRRRRRSCRRRRRRCRRRRRRSCRRRRRC